jgi:hypothetical protein
MHQGKAFTAKALICVCFQARWLYGVEHTLHLMGCCRSFWM